MKKSLYPVAFALLFAGLTGCSGSGTSDPVDAAQNQNERRNEANAANTEMPEIAEKKMDYDSEFLAKAASGGMMEVKLAEDIKGRLTTREAKQYAQWMIDDHTKVNANLQKLAASKNIVLPSMLGDEQQDVYEDVTKKEGLELDQTYLKEMLKDHQHDVEEFTTASMKASDQDIKDFATKTLPILTEHLAAVTKLSSEINARK